jgi:hypothetical protein
MHSRFAKERELSLNQRGMLHSSSVNVMKFNVENRHLRKAANL